MFGLRFLGMCIHVHTEGLRAKPSYMRTHPSSMRAHVGSMRKHTCPKP